MVVHFDCVKQEMGSVTETPTLASAYPTKVLIMQKPFHNNLSFILPSLGLSGLMSTILARQKSAPEGSYTKRLFEDNKLLRAKLLEEATELSEADTKEVVSTVSLILDKIVKLYIMPSQEVAHEAADLLYFTLVACAKAGVSLADVEAILGKHTHRIVTLSVLEALDLIECDTDKRALKVTRRPGDSKQLFVRMIEEAQEKKTTQKVSKPFYLMGTN